VNYNKFIDSVIIKTPQFIEKLIDKETNLYNFSIEGDLHKTMPLSSSVFVSKILHMLNINNNDSKKFLNNHILSFYKSDEKLIYDNYIKKKSLVKRFLKTIIYRNTRYFSYKPSSIAETRQSLSALICNDYDKKIKVDYISDYEEIIKQIIKLDWSKPWHACSQLSHIIFLIKYYENDLVKIFSIIDFVENNYRLKSGGWGKNENISIQQKINGSMKMMTIFMLDSKLQNFNYKNQLIDLCLSSINNKHACDNFNIICCLFNCSIENDYRKNEIKDFALSRIKIYKKYFFDEIGGFSFYINKSQDYYYDAKVTKGKNTPDLQGTTLFLWGIVMISNILETKHYKNFKLPTT
tara:strand:- start:166 stop:1218 length:1053 start_codon:yes stop_codon:yes gene_type:complete